MVSDSHYLQYACSLLSDTASADSEAEAQTQASYAQAPTKLNLGVDTSSDCRDDTGEFLWSEGIIYFNIFSRKDGFGQRR
jgi:hypothetical protein